MNRLAQLQNKLVTLKDEAQNLLNENKVEDAKAKMQEIREVQDAIEMQKELDINVKDSLKNDAGNVQDSAKTKENANIIRAMIKKVTGRQTTEAENALLVPTSGEGTNGEGYILPQDISTKIRKKIREYRSLTEVVGYLPAGALSGSFPIENFETVTELVDFTDGTDGTFSDDIKFANVSYKLKEKGAFIKLSNTLLAMTDNDLINYVVEVFAKKAVITENKMIIAKLKEGKSPKAMTAWTDLRTIINTELDPSMLHGTVIVTNQDGLEFLDSQLDGNNRPLLQPNPTDPTKMTFKGYEVVAYANSMLPTEATKIPFFVGNLSEGVKFVDYKGLVNFATSSEAGFMSNTTLARLIEFIDVIQVDKSDKCYVYAEVTQAGVLTAEAKTRTK